MLKQVRNGCIHVCLEVPFLMLITLSAQVQFVKDTRRLYRTDFFPGLGWMLRRQLWEEFR